MGKLLKNPKVFILLTTVVLLTVVFCYGQQEKLTEMAQAQTGAGPLRVHPNNSRFFIDKNNQPIYLAGHQIFVDLQDNAFHKPYTYDYQEELDWSWYLNFIKERNINYLRSWTHLSTSPDLTIPTITHPMPYLRVAGYDLAFDGGNKFDLDQFDQAFFNRLTARIQVAEAQDIYISIMLFEVYGFTAYNDTLWNANVFKKENNINNIDADYNNDGIGMEFFYSPSEELKNYQKAYVRKIIDTVNQYDNIIYEIANELEAPDWQYEMINYIKTYEQTKPKQHLVYMSHGGRNLNGKWSSMSKEQLVSSGADIFSATHSWGEEYVTDPPVDNSGMPVVIDMDHVDAGGPYNKIRQSAWKAFTRGYHYNLYDRPFERPDEEDEIYDNTRYNVGALNTYATKFNDLAAMNPYSNLASTQYCLANPGQEYLIYQPTSGQFTVDLIAGKYNYEMRQVKL